MLPGIAVHVVQRGNNQSDCFLAQEDREFYLFHLGKLLPRARCRLHAFCLMTNHVHLLLSADQGDGCAQLMKGIGQLHAQYINKRYGRSGYLWQGRFKSCLVQSEDYVLACYRYIELNPVRAGIARRPDEYRWSSYAANATGEPQDMISPHEQYERLGRVPAERQAIYRDLFGEIQQPKRLDEIRAATRGGYALGDAAFRQAMAIALGRRVETGPAGRPVQREKTWSVPDLF